MLRSGVVFVVGVAAASPAWAEVSAPPPPAAPLAPPALTAPAGPPAPVFGDGLAQRPPVVFSTLDPTGEGSHLSIEASTLFPTGESEVAFGGRLTAMYIGRSGFGGYAHLSPYGLDAGAIYQARIDPKFELGFRVGVVPPLGQSFTTGALTDVVAHPADLVMSATEHGALRFSASPTIHGDHVFVRLDVGFDVPFQADLMLARFDVGIGAVFDRVIATLELQTVFPVSDDASGSLETASVSLRGRGAISPYLLLSDLIGDAAPGAAVALSAGISFAM